MKCHSCVEHARYSGCNRIRGSIFRYGRSTVSIVPDVIGGDAVAVRFAVRARSVRRAAVELLSEFDLAADDGA
jgi:hypothetical protein